MEPNQSLSTALKTCSKCKVEQTRDQFCKDNSRPDKLQRWCKACNKASRNPERQAAYMQEYRQTEKYKKTQRNSALKLKFGITVVEYDAMLEKQNGQCAICGTTECGSGKRFAVDHCHTTGSVRGLLCSSCNTALGLLKDNISIIENAITYLSRTTRSEAQG